VTDLGAKWQDGRLRWLSSRTDRFRAQGAALRSRRAGRGIVIGRSWPGGLARLVGDTVDVVSRSATSGPRAASPRPQLPGRRDLLQRMYEFDSKFAYLDLRERSGSSHGDAGDRPGVKVADVDLGRRR